MSRAVAPRMKPSAVSTVSASDKSLGTSDSLPGSETTVAMTKQKEFWIEKVFKKRECVIYVPTTDEKRCGCGHLRTFHKFLASIEASPAAGGSSGAVLLAAAPTQPLSCNGGGALLQSSTLETVQLKSSAMTSVNMHATAAAGIEKWQPSRNSRPFPTDAFGQIEFQGEAHPSKAQYLRLDQNTPPQDVLQLLLNHWRLELPKLLISVHGGIANFDLQPKLKRVFKKGLIKAANTTGAWIITGGTNTGAMKHVGEALAERSVKSTRKKSIVAIGIAPWGVVHKRQDLIGKDISVDYHAVPNAKGNTAVLNSSHNYFLLADNGTNGKYGAEIVLRKRLERYISQQRISTRSGGEKPLKGVPIVCMVLEGGSNTIRTVLDYVTDTPPVPVVVCDGSGRAADLLAFTHKYSNDDGLVPEALREQLVGTIQKTFSYTVKQAEGLYDDLILCTRKKELITVFRLGEQVPDIDLAILTALLKSHNMSPPQQLSLALSWDRVDLARSHIFTYGQDWPDGSLEQAMLDALIHDKVDFVQLLLEKGVNMNQFLTIPRLEELYNGKSGSNTTLYMVLRDVRKNKPLSARVTLIEVGLMMDRLMGGAYRSNYCRRKFKHVYHEMKRCMTCPMEFEDAGTTDAHTFEYPFSELMIWAILLKRQEMAKFMWRREEEALSKAVVASKLYKALAKEAAEDALVDNAIAVELLQYGKEFQKLALEVLDYSFRQDDELAQQLLTYELKNWSRQTCLSLAYAAGMRDFIAHTCCQNLITDMWMGGLRMNKNHNLKVIIAILMPLVIPKLGYKSQEELQLMPQTVEEHWLELENADSTADDDDDDACPSIAEAESGPLLTWSGDGCSSENYADDNEAGSVVTWQPVTAENGSSVPSKDGQGRPEITVSAPPTQLMRSDTMYSSFGPQRKRKQELKLSKKVYEFYSAPVTKFWMHTIAYFLFLGAFNYTVLVKMDRVPHWMEVYVMAYVFFHTIEMIREIAIAEPPKLAHKLSVFFLEKWNIIDLVSIPLFWTGVSLRFQASTTINLWGKVLYSLDLICWYIRILELFQVSRNLGPFVVIIEKLVRDITSLIAFFAVFVLAFGVARQAILSPVEDPEWNLAKKAVMQPYFMIFGEVYAYEIDPPCGGNNTDIPVCWPGRWFVPIMQSIYLLSTYVLLINLLIAVFNYTFQQLHSNSLQIWMYQRYGLTVEYEVKPLLPPPFIVVSHLYLLYKWLWRLARKKPHIRDFGLKLFLNDNDIRKLHDFEEDCVEAYFRNLDSKFESSAEERIRTTHERVENIMLRMDDINQKENQMKLSLAALEHRSVTTEAIALQCKLVADQVRDLLLASLPQLQLLQQPSTPQLPLDRGSVSPLHTADGSFTTLWGTADAPLDGSASAQSFGLRVRHTSGAVLTDFARRSIRPSHAVAASIAAAAARDEQAEAQAEAADTLRMLATSPATAEATPADSASNDIVLTDDTQRTAETESTEPVVFLMGDESYEMAPSASHAAAAREGEQPSPQLDAERSGGAALAAAELNRSNSNDAAFAMAAAAACGSVFRRERQLSRKVASAGSGGQKVATAAGAGLSIDMSDPGLYIDVSPVTPTASAYPVIPLPVDVQHVVAGSVPIMKPRPTEYTSITDSIDMSCLLVSQSPVHSPTSLQGRFAFGDDGEAEPIAVDSVIATEEQTLRMAEENVTRVIGGALRKRIRGLSVNESTHSFSDMVDALAADDRVEGASLRQSLRSPYALAEGQPRSTGGPLPPPSGAGHGGDSDRAPLAMSF